MRIFAAVVHKDLDSAYGISFPDAPGCFSAADDLDRLVPNAAEALSLYFAGRPVPEPRGLDAVCTEVAADLAEGATLVGIPLLRSL